MEPKKGTALVAGLIAVAAVAAAANSADERNVRTTITPECVTVENERKMISFQECVGTPGIITYQGANDETIRLIKDYPPASYDNPWIYSSSGQPFYFKVDVICNEGYCFRSYRYGFDDESGEVRAFYLDVENEEDNALLEQGGQTWLDICRELNCLEARAEWFAQRLAVREGLAESIQRSE